jgi:hypothetical protein
MRLRRKNLARKVYCGYVQVRAFQVIVYKSIIDSENDVRNPGAEQIEKSTGTSGGHKRIPEAAPSQELLGLEHGWLFPKPVDAKQRNWRVRNRRAGLYPPVLDFCITGLGTQEDDRIWILLGARYDRPNSVAEGLVIGVVVIAWDEDHDGVWISLKYMDERHGDGHTSTAIQRLGDDARFVHVP